MSHVTPASESTSLSAYSPEKPRVRWRPDGADFIAVGPPVEAEPSYSTTYNRRITMTLTPDSPRQYTEAAILDLIRKAKSGRYFAEEVIL